MAANVEIFKTEISDGELVGFAPIDAENHGSIQIPKTFTRKAKYIAFDLVAELSCSFEEDKIVLNKLTLEKENSSLATRDLLKLSLPWVIQKVAIDVIPNSHRWSVSLADLSEREGKPRDETLLYLAQLYWFEYVSWGNPRETIMKTWDISRTTANTWIKQAAKLYGLPGAHSEADRGNKD